MKALSAVLTTSLVAASSASATVTHYYYDPVNRLAGGTSYVGQDHAYRYDNADSRSYFSALVNTQSTNNQTLEPGQTLLQGQSLNSPNSSHILVLQDDSNLVLYHGGTAIWVAPNTQYKQGAKLFLQTDGNLVYYSAQLGTLWSTGTSGTGTHLVVQDDGNLVLYNSNYTVALWASNTAGL